MKSIRPSSTIADSHSTFLPAAREAGDVDVLFGDARLTLERQAAAGRSICWPSMRSRAMPS